jgi:hypothetical protein
MYRVNLIFDTENPDSEDQEVRDYLVQHELEPKYQGAKEYEGRQCEMMLFGGCYLGRHLNHIGEIQRHAVEIEILTAKIEAHLSSDNNELFSVAEEGRQEAVAQLVQEFHQESTFQTNENGEVYVALDESALLAAARRLSVGS